MRALRPPLQERHAARRQPSEQQHVPKQIRPIARVRGTAEKPPALTEREQQILAFESKWWKHAGSKEQAIRDTFGLSSTRYYQLLNGLLDNPAALEQTRCWSAACAGCAPTRARTRRRLGVSRAWVVGVGLQPGHLDRVQRRRGPGCGRSPRAPR